MDERNSTDDVSTENQGEEEVYELEPVEDAPSANSPASSKEQGGEELEQMKDRYLRLRADFENYRKRTEREKSDYSKQAGARVISELLPVVDNLERALSVPGGAEDDFRRGVELIYKQLLDVLQRQGVTIIDPLGAEFNPAIHDAIAREETSEAPSHTVTAVLQKGYLLNDRLLRPALVRVAVEPSGESS